LATTELILGIQADMQIHEKGFDIRLAELINSNPEIGLVTCRGVHNFSEISFRNLESGSEISSLSFSSIMISNLKLLSRCLLRRNSNLHDTSNSIRNIEGLQYAESAIFPDTRSGKAGFLSEFIDLIPHQYEEEISTWFRKYRNQFWVGETGMRGPVLFRRVDYLNLGGLNVLAFFQGLDDHDLNLRFKSINKSIAFSPIYFSSPLRIGVSRKRKTIWSQFWINTHRRIRQKNLHNSSLFRFLRD
jgi:hypothetical protein